MAIPIFLIGIFVRLTSNGPALYWSKRIGAKGVLFEMPKFRTMYTDTPEVATDTLVNPRQWLTPIGAFLRKSSLDELPQLWSIVRGDMSLVGPRPALFNQLELINRRKEFGIDALAPGLTGWAQVNGRDELSIEEKVALDQLYLLRQSIIFDVHILWITFAKVIKRQNITH